MSLFSLLGNLILIFLLLATGIATYILLKKSTGVSFKILYAVLILTLISELLGKLTVVLDFKGIIDQGNNILIFNICEFLVFPLLFFMYFNLIKTKKRKLIPVFFFVFVLTCFIEGFFITDLTKQYETYPFIIGSIGLSFCSVFYFTQILEDGSFEKIKNNFFIWVSCGILIYYLGNTPFISVTNVFAFETETKNLFFVIAKILAVNMYALICIGLLRYKISDE